MHEYELWVVVRGSGDGNGARVACLLLGARGEVSVETWPREVFSRQNSNSQEKVQGGRHGTMDRGESRGLNSCDGASSGLWKFGSLVVERTWEVDVLARLHPAHPVRVSLLRIRLGS